MSELLDRYEREQRLTAVGEAYAMRPKDGYLEEIAAWDEAAADGLAE